VAVRKVVNGCKNSAPVIHDRAVEERTGEEGWRRSGCGSTLGVWSLEAGLKEGGAMTKSKNWNSVRNK
jgi:hypothetical protein